MTRKMLLLTLVVAFVLAVLTVVMMSGCHECKKQAMRCDGERVQLCAPSGRWKTIMDCSRLHRTKQQYGCVRLFNGRCTCRLKRVK